MGDCYAQRDRAISYSTNSRTPKVFRETRRCSLVPRLVPEGKAHMMQDRAISIFGIRLQHPVFKDQRNWIAADNMVTLWLSRALTRLQQN